MGDYQKWCKTRICLIYKNMSFIEVVVATVELSGVFIAIPALVAFSGLYAFGKVIYSPELTFLNSLKITLSFVFLSLLLNVISAVLLQILVPSVYDDGLGAGFSIILLGLLMQIPACYMLFRRFLPLFSKKKAFYVSLLFSLMVNIVASFAFVAMLIELVTK